MLGLSVLASIPCADGKKTGKYGCYRAYGAKERRPYQEKKRGGGKGEVNKTVLKLPGADDFFTQEAFKTLRTNLQFCGQDIRTVVITSCNENEGKTTVTLQLGKSLAELGKRVLVIDADMRKSVMAGRNTTAASPAGLSEVLTGQQAMADCLYETQHKNLELMFAGKYPPNPVELLGTVRESYDYVLIDLPPLGSVIDAAVVAAKCDGAILVISDHQVRCHQAVEVVDQLKKCGSRILGVVRNNIHANGSGYYKKYYKDRYQ